MDQFEELYQQFLLQKQSLINARFPKYAERKMHLERLLKMVKNNADKIIETISDDFGNRAAKETQFSEILSVIQSIKFALKHLQEWMRPQSREVAVWFKPATARLVAEPLGVVGIVVPWNYPVGLALKPMVSALAAGNKVMVKMSELTPKTGELLKGLIQDAFSLQDIQIINGEVEVAKQFVALPFDYLLFTGSTKTGREVMKIASKHLTPVTLELGGKSPVIIAPDYPIETAVERILFGKLFNAGQTCIAPDYLFMTEGSERLFVEKAKDFVSQYYCDFVNNVDYTSIINTEHFSRLQALCDDAIKKGARMVVLSDQVSHKEHRKFMPCLFFNVTSEMRIMQEEIFGPILPILTYADVDEAVRYIAERPHPLALYLFDNNMLRVYDILRRTQSGGVTINDTLLHAAQEDLPFGGVGESGIGQYHGKAGFDTFTHYRSLYFQSQFNLASFMKKRFSSFSDKLIKWF